LAETPERKQTRNNRRGESESEAGGGSRPGPARRARLPKEPLDAAEKQLLERRLNLHRLRTANFYLVAAALIVVCYLLLTASIAPFNGVCAWCHATSVDDFERSPHAGIRCSSCHGGMSYADILSFRLSLTGMPFYLFARPTVRLQVRNETCLGCHPAIASGTVKSASGIAMSHAEVIQGGFLCSDCHRIDAHRKEYAESGFVDMFVCLTCHNGVKATKKCAACHLNRDYRVKKAGDYRTNFVMIHVFYDSHGKGSLKSCGTCHDENYCSSCHILIKRFKVDLPHPRDWFGMHGFVTGRDKVKICYACHQEKNCRSCHIVEMPHPLSYLGSHKKEARTLGEDVCLRCHLKQGCDTCHQNHRHPGIPAELRRRLQRRLSLE
jgi:hypothetical protein